MARTTVTEIWPERDLEFFSTDGSPYWPFKERNTPSAAGDPAYAESLKHFSAGHSPSIDRDFKDAPLPNPDADDEQTSLQGGDTGPPTPSQGDAGGAPLASIPHQPEPVDHSRKPTSISMPVKTPVPKAPNAGDRSQPSISEEPLVGSPDDSYRLPSSLHGSQHRAKNT
jgi:hypothetical protein